ncbi:MAG TPA: NAD(P)-dependent oxidoreductase [Bryobacteraceae bacterium]|nr:NAD(P)-dependent oxidoreductase [Bryobacteraceae bacterium]
MPQDDKVVVIGGAGFIGSRLTRFLLDEGNTVIVTSRTAGARTSDDPRLSYRSVAVTDAEGISKVIEGANVVYDLSMSGGLTWEEHKKEVVDSAVHVARACQKHGVRRLIYTSSTAALYLAGNGTVTEAAGADKRPEDRSFYSRGKIEAERALLKLYETEKLPVVIFRPAVVLGPGGMLVHGAFGELPPASDVSILGFGNGKTPLPCVLVDDVARALQVGKDAPGIDGMAFNLAGDVRPSVTQYVQWMREATHRNFRFYGRPIWFIQAGEIARWALKSLGRKPNNTLGSLRDVESAPMSAQLDCSLAKKMLGWKPVADETEFKKQALLCHVNPLPPGDVRLEPRR